MSVVLGLVALCLLVSRGLLTGLETSGADWRMRVELLACCVVVVPQAKKGSVMRDGVIQGTSLGEKGGCELSRLDTVSENPYNLYESHYGQIICVY